MLLMPPTSFVKMTITKLLLVSPKEICRCDRHYPKGLGVKKRQIVAPCSADFLADELPDQTQSYFRARIRNIRENPAECEPHRHVEVIRPICEPRRPAPAFRRTESSDARLLFLPPGLSSIAWETRTP